MKCCFLSGKYMYSCSASKDVYVPSAFEIEEYCRNSRYKLCSLYYMRISSDSRPVADSQSQNKADNVFGRENNVT